MRNAQRIQADLFLLLTAVIWGSAFVVQRVAAQNAGTFLFNGLRFWLGALVLTPVLWISRRDPGSQGEAIRPESRAISRKNLAWIAAAGALLYAASALQQAGLKYTTAANAGFLTGVYVVFVPVILTLFLKQKVRWISWAATLAAAVGVFLLSGSGQLRLAPGDSLELIGSVFWALHVITVGQAVRRIDLLPFSIGQFLWAGTLNLITGLAVEQSFWAAIGQAWWAIAYTGILSVGAGYTLQAAGQRHSPATDAALILSLEAVFAALFGFLIIHEGLLPIQISGCGLIFAAVVAVTLKT